MAHVIQGREVTEEDIDSPVTYIPTHANGNASHPDVERGRISSFNERTLWVRFKSINGESVNPKDLVWG